MVTKLKRFSTHRATKTIAFLLVIASLTMTTALVQSLMYKNIQLGTYMQMDQAERQEQLDELLLPVSTIGGLLVAAIALIVFLIVVTGRRAADAELHAAKIDRVYSDVLLMSLLFFALIWLRAVTSIPYWVESSLNTPDLQRMYEITGVGFYTAILTSLSGIALLSLARKAKAGKLLKHSFIYTVSFIVYDFCKSLFDGRKFARFPLTKSLFYRQLLFISASAVLVFFTLLLLAARSDLVLLPPIVEMIIIYWFIKGNNATFDDINKGFDDSITEQMRAERMKIELVTNVSHDLKTPLTSIISYVDLLAKEEHLSETANDYIHILKGKSNQLKNIVADLFDLAKSSSGDISLQMERLDMKTLIEQTLGDMEQDIAASGLQIKTKLPDEALFIQSDGKKLQRVFQNVIDNALKYSLSGTRVYIDLEKRGDKAVASIKNTAGYEMEFSAEEILQRFSRGDKARTTEGSGLGLSIAESFTHVCGGDFRVYIDGDLFKVMIAFSLAE